MKEKTWEDLKWSREKKGTVRAFTKSVWLQGKVCIRNWNLTTVRSLWLQMDRRTEMGEREKADERGKWPHKEFSMILHREGSLMARWARAIGCFVDLWFSIRGAIFRMKSTALSSLEEVIRQSRSSPGSDDWSAEETCQCLVKATLGRSFKVTADGRNVPGCRKTGSLSAKRRALQQTDALGIHCRGGGGGRSSQGF